MTRYIAIVKSKVTAYYTITYQDSKIMIGRTTKNIKSDNLFVVKS